MVIKLLLVSNYFTNSVRDWSREFMVILYIPHSSLIRYFKVKYTHGCGLAGTAVSSLTRNQGGRSVVVGSRSKWHIGLPPPPLSLGTNNTAPLISQTSVVCITYGLHMRVIKKKYKTER